MTALDTEPQTETEHASEVGQPGRARRGSAGRRSLLWPAITVVVGVLITSALVLVSGSQYSRNEKRLLHLRVRDAGALLAEALPGIQTPLSSAAELADATNGDVARFMRFAAPYVGTGPGQFASFSLWKLTSVGRGPLAVDGIAPKLAQSPSSASAFFASVAKRPQLSVIGLLASPDPRLGFGYAARHLRGYAVYVENRLPANRRSALQSSNQFAGLHYAIYLGANQRPQNLLVTDVPRPPLPGRRTAVAVPFGNTALTLAMSTQKSLAGSLPQRLPWIIAIGGALLTLVATVLTGILVRRREEAEQLADRLKAIAYENEELYAEQRTIAQTLQHALLPEQLPQVPGVETGARYQAGEHGVDIGGDWYDVIALKDQRLLVVVGDVTGRGVRAAAMMARLRYAIQAYAGDHDDPAALLTRLSRLVKSTGDWQLATILCGIIDIEQRQISLASAGHLPALLIANGDAHFVEVKVGLPIGLEPDSPYVSTTVPAPPAATLLAFTDGLVEHRGEHLDQSLEHLRQVAVRGDLPLPELLGTLVDELQSGGGPDDIAILGVRWRR